MHEDQFFFDLVEGRYVPSGLGTSPWNPAAQNGIALAGLAAHLLETMPGAPGMHPARLQIDILGAVPMEPLDSGVRAIREGRRMQLLECELTCAGRPALRASMLRLRTEATPEVGLAAQEPIPPLDETAAVAGDARFAEGYRISGAMREPGPGSRWLRLTVPVVRDVPLTPFQRVAMAADYGSGTAPLVPFKSWTSANIDISLHLARLPRGEWLYLDARSESAGNGIGLVNVRLGDGDGIVGTSHQTIFVDRRIPN